jgi:anaerobic selenocysteine-containing dehydrogenase
LGGSLWPGNFVEIRPDGAKAFKIESGDMVKLTNDDMLIQTGGTRAVRAIAT